MAREWFSVSHAASACALSCFTSLFMDRHRYFGALAPNSPLRAAVTAMALHAIVQHVTDGVAEANTGLGAPSPPPGNAAQPTPAPPKHPSHYLWAVLIARIYEVFSLLWEDCDVQPGEGALKPKSCAIFNFLRLNFLFPSGLDSAHGSGCGDRHHNGGRKAGFWNLCRFG
jgi:hypothetical protein